MKAKTRATIDDLYALPSDQKAEIVRGEIVLMSPTGSMPGRAAGSVFVSLLEHERKFGGGHAFGDNVGFAVDLPERGSFSPDAAWYVGDVDSMNFLEGAPLFAVEVRSKSDYGPHAENDMVAKIRDYFAAGTQVVWDVDLLGIDVIKVYRPRLGQTDEGAVEVSAVFRRSDVADAEPAVPGWRFPVDDLFK